MTDAPEKIWAWEDGIHNEWEPRSFRDFIPGDTEYTRSDLCTPPETVRALVEALEEAHPYVPDHHGPVQHKIRTALAKYRGGPECH